MKRYRRFGAMLVMLAVLCIASCGTTVGGMSKENPLEFLKGQIRLEGILEMGEKEYGVCLQAADAENVTVTFTSPESMEGYVFEKAKDGFYVSYKDLRVPLRQSTSPGGAGSLLNLLSLDGMDFEKREEKANGMQLLVYTFPDIDGAKVKLYLKKNDLTPLRIEFDLEGTSAVFHIQKAEY